MQLFKSNQKKRDKREILNFLNELFKKAGINYAKAKIYLENRNQFEEAEICNNKFQVCDVIHEVIQNELKGEK